MLSVHCRSNIIKCQSAGKIRKRMVWKTKRNAFSPYFPKNKLPMKQEQSSGKVSWGRLD